MSNNLKIYRKAAGLTQRQVAKLLGLTNYGQVCKWERGLCYPSVPNLFKLALLYKTSTDSLYSDLLQGSEER